MICLPTDGVFGNEGVSYLNGLPFQYCVCKGCVRCSFSITRHLLFRAMLKGLSLDFYLVCLVLYFNGLPLDLHLVCCIHEHANTFFIS